MKQPPIFKKFLNDTYHHYNFELPETKNRFLDILLKFFFSKINVYGKDVFKNIPDDSIVVYVGKYKSVFEFLFYNKTGRKNDVPVPEIAFDNSFSLFKSVSSLLKVIVAKSLYFITHFRFINPYKNGYLKEKLLSGKTGFLHLFGKNSFYNRFVKSKTDPIAYLLKTQKETGKDIYLVTQIMFFSIFPEKEKKNISQTILGTQERPSKIKRFFKFFKKGNIFVEFGAAIRLKDFIAAEEDTNESLENSSQKLRNLLIEHFNRHRQNVAGPILKSRQEVIESILTSQNVKNFINEYAIDKKKPTQAVYKKANNYLKEIASDYNPNYLILYKFILNKVVNSLFDGIVTNIDELKKLKLKSSMSPIVFVPCHKSHLDYLLISYLLHYNNMPCPCIAAGKNLSFWPLGSIFRKGGAFFLRRTFKGANLYTKVFSEYVEKILKEGFNIELFIEGGRSRTGKLLSPKLGLLSFLLKAYKNKACEDLIFVPIYVGYDRILEEKSYIKEVKGGSKDNENLKQVLKSSKFLRKRKHSKKYGKIYINCNEPISLKKYLINTKTDINSIDDSGFKSFCKKFGHKLTRGIDAKTIITPYSIFAATILNQSKTYFNREEMFDAFNFYLRLIKSKYENFSDTLKEDVNLAFENILFVYEKRGFIKKYQDKDTEIELNTVYKLNEASRTRVEYYKNNSVTFFVPLAFTAFAILNKTKDAKDTNNAKNTNNVKKFDADSLIEIYDKLSFILSNEFFYHRKNKASKNFIKDSLDVLVDENIVIKKEDELYLIQEETGCNSLKTIAFLLKSYLESYSVVFEYMYKLPEKKSIKLSDKEKIKNITLLGERMLERNIIGLRESISKMNYKNALSLLKNNELISKNKEELKVLEEFIRKHLKLVEY